ncbi:hypothetical protein Xbed_03693 [Xenorhabdus beddingii]|uniref:Tetratricopeptide repeat protein n=1 Tax=Xenorhabdus beddingii TaxID=40578 RepID=A0A1Y2S9E8_9GAMM|nr:hypothetical protein [Xenorhabdus beddingii]OTA14325.1 hypothetical protein Xbed_03693 [Xenorhabdus beddingii]
MTQPLLKKDALADELTDALMRGDSITEFELRRYLNDIEKYSSGIELAYLKALANGLANKKGKAIEYFEIALQIPNIVYAGNYLAYIHHRGLFSERRELSQKLARQYESPSFCFMAYQVNIFHGDVCSANEFYEKYLKLSQEKESGPVIKNFQGAKTMLQDFLDGSGLNRDQVAIIANNIIDVIDNHRVKVSGIEIISAIGHEEKVNMYSLSVYTDDVELLTTMNLELSYKLAEYDELLDKKFSALIRGDKREEREIELCL